MAYRIPVTLFIAESQIPFLEGVDLQDYANDAVRELIAHKNQLEETVGYVSDVARQNRILRAENQSLREQVNSQRTEGPINIQIVSRSRI